MSSGKPRRPHRIYKCRNDIARQITLPYKSHPIQVHISYKTTRMYCMQLSYCEEEGGPGVASMMGKKLPTISAGLAIVSIASTLDVAVAYIFHASRLTVKEKQHRISGSFEFGSGFFKEQLVRIAFWVWSNAMAPNFSQYDTSDGSAMISCKAILPCLESVCMVMQECCTYISQF
jgi:hypothetical protein